MYQICRHIKPNGLRCQSPALKQACFCYFHAKLHSVGAEPYEKYGATMRLPSPEGSAAILLSLAKINDALINGRIDPKRAGQLLYSMQIASQQMRLNRDSEEDEQVESFITDSDGEELAPEEFVCKEGEDCEKCPHVDKCTKWVEVDDEVSSDEPSQDASIVNPASGS